MSDGCSLETSALVTTAQTLRSVAGELEAQVSALAIGPDAGASTGEVRRAFADLSQGVQTLAEATSTAAVGVEQTLLAYQSSDDSVARHYGGATTP